MLFDSITHACVHTDTLVYSSIIARYAAYRKFSIIGKTLPKLILYGKYGTQRMGSRKNIALGFASCYIYLLPIIFMPYYPYSAHDNVST